MIKKDTQAYPWVSLHFTPSHQLAYTGVRLAGGCTSTTHDVVPRVVTTAVITVTSMFKIFFTISFLSMSLYH